MYLDLTILLSLHVLYNIVDQVRSGEVLSKFIITGLINTPDKKLKPMYRPRSDQTVCFYSIITV